ncbi:hypothetical protein FHX14_001793 [Rhizobium sp. BK619]|uniref:bifunctional DNA primase/polymerase n=1 Tax=Rhizobium sp. BK619 TaxID=2586989 RepID=UPI0016128A36|nr:bifunctional DNA primase/polymerase [Rhizobium sp. BK619]MBB3645614.1 hypothetical protein [Rhizobium sp. BK619]
MAAFAEWQPRYAAHGIATFPVVIDGKDKRPAVKGYLKLGSKVSDQLALRFPAHDAIGLACRRNNITVLDVDTTDERVLADGLSRHGQTPFIVRSGSGHYQAWYRHNGERRRVRPDLRLPIDILGDGYVVAPPSLGSKGRYQVIQGKMDDLDSLPVMIHPEIASEPETSRLQEDSRRTSERRESAAPTFGKQGEGNRNQTLWLFCMKAVRGCHKIEELLEKAMRHNGEAYCQPLPTEEVLKVVASAWGYEVEGKNWFGHGARVVMHHSIVDNLAAPEPRAFALLSLLMRNHWGRTFYLTKAYASSIGWAVNTLKDARDVLIRLELIECIHEGGKGPNDPPEFQFGKGVKN